MSSDWKKVKTKVLQPLQEEKRNSVSEPDPNEFSGLVFQLLSELRIKKQDKPIDVGSVLFDLLDNGDGMVSVEKLWHAVETTGLRRTDPRLESCRLKFEEKRKAADCSEKAFKVNKADFSECVTEGIGLLGKAFQNDMVIPEFHTFATKVKELYENCKSNTNGKPADYIPTLALGNPKHWAVSVCTVDGQRCSFGDAKEKFCIQSCSKPLSYSVAISDLSAEEVHKYVGQEPSGRSFNKLTLDKNKKPHNPMINAGAIMTASLCKPGLDPEDRFLEVQNHYRKLAGEEFIGFDEETYISEKETADRNYALAYYMKENKGFPVGADMWETCDLYFKLCSVEATSESASVIAATLANGGICPINNERVLSGEAVKHSLSLMYSCGMYDYSGQFAFRVGLPAKSGVAGAVLLVVPNVLGICAWSPPLDEMGNSCRGVQFCEDLVDTFNFHNYDSLGHSGKIDPRQKTLTKDERNVDIVDLMYSVTEGDLNSVQSYIISGGDLSKGDYNGRTALHQAAAEGHLDIAKLLVGKLKVPHDPKDRWGFTPLDEARKFNRKDVEEYLVSCQEDAPKKKTSCCQQDKSKQNGNVEK